MGGEIASKIAIHTLASRIDALASREIDDDSRIDILQSTLTDIEGELAERINSTPELLGMGTTLTALAVVPGEQPVVYVANVGDSRTYLFRNGVLSRISVDHSYVQELVNEGIITPEEARVHPRRNIVTRAMGIERSVMVDVFSQTVRTGDRLVLCSDGLVDEVSDADITAVLTQHSDPQETAEALVMVANANGGRDNTTVIVVDILDDKTAESDWSQAAVVILRQLLRPQP